LIALGLVDNMQQVSAIIEAVDDDGSGEIEFPEFLEIIKGGSKKAKIDEVLQKHYQSAKPEEEGIRGPEKCETDTAAIYSFFKSLTNGDLISKDKANMPFGLFISAHRRKMIIDSMMKEGSEQKTAERIKGNYQKQLNEKFSKKN
jgi:type I site-specific restriction-modification system R (restriction) subunit